MMTLARMNTAGAGRQSCRQAQRGVSLVELLIGMVLGLIVVSAAFNMYAGSSRSSEFSRGLQTMQENGRYAASVMQQGLRLAGYSPDVRLDPLDMASGDENTLIVQTRNSVDCNGQSTAANAGVAVNRYRFNAGSGTISCTGNSASATDMPIIEGVDGFRVLYGLDQVGGGDGVPEQYVPFDAGINPREIVSMRFALLVNSGTPIRSRNASETHVLFDRELAFNDRMARNVFESTVILRNGQ